MVGVASKQGVAFRNRNPSSMSPSPEIKTEDRQERRWLGLERPHFAGWQWKVLVLLTAVNLLN